MDLKQYITESEKQYRLRLKTVTPIDDDKMDQIENYVARYNPISISRPSKTILQREPLDFPNVLAAEVYIVDFIFGLPCAPHVLRADLRKLLDAPENYVFVRDMNEWGEIETARLNALADIEAEAERRGLKLAPLLTDPDYNDAEHDHAEMFGTDYNAALVAYLSDVEKEKRVAREKVETAPFKWLDLVDGAEGFPEQDKSNYNANIDDAPFVTWKPKKKPDVSQSILGSLDLSRGEIRRVFVDAKGNKVVLKRTLGGEEK